jgi:integrase
VNRELATLRRLLRLAQEWKVLDRVPRIRLLRGERNRDFVLTHRLELKYLGAAPQPLKDVAILILESGVRPGEAANLQWPDVYLEAESQLDRQGGGHAQRAEGSHQINPVGVPR